MKIIKDFVDGKKRDLHCASLRGVNVKAAEQFNLKTCDDRTAFQVGGRYKSLRRLIRQAQSHQDSS